MNNTSKRIAAFLESCIDSTMPSYVGEIFNANKTSDECHLSFLDEGLLRLIFTSQDEGIDTTYFVVRKADY